MKKQWALIVLAAILCGICGNTSNAAQKRGGSAAASRKHKKLELLNAEQLKESFQIDAGKVRLVALVSPT